MIVPHWMHKLAPIPEIPEQIHERCAPIEACIPTMDPVARSSQQDMHTGMAAVDPCVNTVTPMLAPAQALPEVQRIETRRSPAGAEAGFVMSGVNAFHAPVPYIPPMAPGASMAAFEPCVEGTPPLLAATRPLREESTIPIHSDPCGHWFTQLPCKYSTYSDRWLLSTTSCPRHSKSTLTRTGPSSTAAEPPAVRKAKWLQGMGVQ